MRGAFDFETWEWKNPLCCGFVWGDKDNRQQHYIHDSSHTNPKAVARAALLYMYTHEEADVWWGHNAGRFDVQFLLEAAIDMGFECDAICNGGRAIKVTFRRPGQKHRLYVQDTMALVPQALRKCVADFELAHGKLFTESDYSRDTRTWNKDKLREGCIIDALLVLELCERLDILVNGWGGNLRSTFSSTALSCVRHAIKDSGYDDFPDMRKHQWVNQWCRGGYFGGRVEVFHHCPDSLLTEWDINSSYPYSMTMPLPWEYLGAAETRRGLDRIIEGDRAGVVYARVTVPHSQFIPPLPYRPASGGIYFPVGTWESAFAGNELRYAMEMGCRVEPLEGHAFTVESPFADFVARVYADKASATGARRNFDKLILNGCYGKFGQAPEREVLNIAPDNETAYERIASNPLGSIGQLGSDPRFQTKVIKRWPRQTHYALASYITAYSRIWLHQGLMASDQPAYVDTDAIHARRASLSVGGALGEWKEEMRDYRALFWAPKIYELHPLKGEPHYAAKGFRIEKDGKPDKAMFRRIVAGELVENGSRNCLIKTQLRKGGQVFRQEDERRWAGRSRKRRPLKDGSTVPWTVEELDREVHLEARNPMFDGVNTDED